MTLNIVINGPVEDPPYGGTVWVIDLFDPVSKLRMSWKTANMPAIAPDCIEHVLEIVVPNIAKRFVKELNRKDYLCQPH